MDDATLLRRYVEEVSEEAFGELVRRHIGWLYAAALRQVRDPHLAEDVTQATFIILARKGRTIGKGAVLSGWLLRTVRYTAQNALRMESRRRRHEKEAAMSRPERTSGEEQWEQVAGVLESAVATLGQADRDAIALRFYERLPQAEVAAALGVSEAAAGKRVARAVDRLRQTLGKAGVSLPATTLVAVLAARPAEAAPAALASSIAAGHASSAASSLVSMTLRTMGLVKAKLLAIAAVVGMAVLLPVAVWMAAGDSIAAAPATQPAQQVAQSPPVAEKPSFAHIRTMHVVGTEYEIWMERGMGITMRDKATGTVSFSDGQRQWRQVPGQHVVSQWRSRLSPEMFLEYTARGLAEYRPQLQRDPAGDRIIDGVTCQHWTLRMEEEHIQRIWLDPAGWPRLLVVSQSNDAQQVRCEYNVPVDPARLARPGGADVQVVDIDAWFEERFPIDSALYREDVLGGHFTVHQLQRGEGDEIYLVLANRLSETTANEAPPLPIEPFMMSHYVAEPSMLFAATDERSTHSAYRVAAARGDRWVVTWHVLVPKQRLPVELAEVNMTVHIASGFAHAHDWLRSKGLPASVDCRFSLPLPDAGPRRVLETVLGELHAQAEQWHAVLFWFRLSRTERQERAITRGMAAPGEYTRHAFIENTMEEILKLGGK